MRILYCLCLLFFLSGFESVAAKSSKKNAAETYRLLNMFNESFRHIRNDYVTPVSDEQLIEAAINGMLNRLDPYSNYISQERYKNMLSDMKGELEGIGIELTSDGNITKIITPIEGSPAWNAGLKAGDEIVSINGKLTHGVSLLAIGEFIQDADNETVQLEIKRREIPVPFIVHLKRQKIFIENVRWMIQDKIAYIRLTDFNSNNTGDHLKKALVAILSMQPKGIILDLRNNPGGLLEEALKCADFFIEQGVLVSVQPRAKDKTRVYSTSSHTLVPKISMIVLINEGTASCAEIVAGALQDHHRALIIGTASFGKGTVQSILPLSPGYAAIRLTTAYYLTPSGKNIQTTGIHPDVIIEQGKMPNRDIQRAEALGLLKAQCLDTQDVS
jgi:carboxyl-terminal processing protease